MAAEETEETTAPEPMALAMDLLMGTLGNLDKSSLNADTREATANVLSVVHAFALMDIANSLREIKEQLRGRTTDEL